MAHHIYHTRGIILSSSSIGESNRFYRIFTEELGLVGATAQSIREGRSKLRYTLQDYSLVTVDLVRGKEVWRIVSAGTWSQCNTIKYDPVRLKLFARFCALLSRLLHGEGCDQELFEEIVRVADFLEKKVIPEDLHFSLEILASLRILVHLGYLDPKEYVEFLTPEAYSTETLMEFEKIRSFTIPKINESLSASHL